MKFSEKLIKLRKENKLSQEQLASKLDVSRQSVSKWESGQTYPEMDKLLSLCKIFKCSLDDLTNDEIEDMSNNQTKKNSFINLIYEILEFINKSISMLKAMSFKEIIKMGFELFLLCIFLFILRIPFALVLDALWSLLWNIDISYHFVHIVGNIGEFLINAIYLILFAIVFIYIYKVRYLDKFSESEKVIVKYINEKKEETKETDKTKKEIKVEERVVVKKERSFALFNVLGTIMKYIIKFIAICIFLPFVCTLAILAFFLIIDIVLIFKGVIFIGIILGLIFALLFNYMIIEVMFKFIFNMHINFKKIFIMFIVGVFGIGISVGIFTLEATSLKVYDEIPKEIESTTIVKEMEIDKDSYIFFNNSYYVYVLNGQYDVEINDWELDIVKKHDENMKDKVKIEFTYNKDYTNLEIFEENKKLEVVKYSNNDYNTLINLGNIIIDNLKNKEIYNYDTYDYQQVKVVITTSESNHELLEKNAKELAIRLHEREQENLSNQYQQEIYNLEEEIDNLNEKIYELEEEYNNLEIEKDEEINTLKEQIEQKEQELQEYKDRISELLDE